MTYALLLISKQFNLTSGVTYVLDLTTNYAGSLSLLC